MQRQLQLRVRGGSGKDAIASRSPKPNGGSASAPPQPARAAPADLALDKVLQKAASKKRILSHPQAVPAAPQGNQRSPAQPSPARSRVLKDVPVASSSRNERADIDDGDLLAGITEDERDEVWTTIQRAVGDTGGDSWKAAGASSSGGGGAAGGLAKRRSAPASARDGLPAAAEEPVASSSAPRGFGSAPPKQQPRAAPVASAKAPKGAAPGGAKKKAPAAAGAASPSSAPGTSGRGSAGAALQVDDDALIAGISQQERDSVWEDIQRVVGDSGSSSWADDEPAGVSLAKHRSAPASARDGLPGAEPEPPVASSSGFKGFGSLPKRTADAASASSQPLPSQSQPQQAQLQKQGKRGAAKQQQQQQQPVRVFLFNAEAAQVTQLVEQLGLARRVVVVGSLKEADAILAAKLSKAGKHANLLQAERTAANAGVPFVVVGRNMTADNLRPALQALLEPGTAGAGQTVVSPRGSRQPTWAELAAHRAEVMQGFGELLRNPDRFSERAEAAGGGSGAAGAGPAAGADGKSS